MQYTALSVISLFFLFLFFFMFFKSVMGNAESYGDPQVRFFPTEWHFENYLKVFDEKFIRYFFNTLLVIAITIVGVPFAAAMCAFGFSKCEFPGRNLCFAATLATMMLPAAVSQVSLYVLFRTLGMIGNLSPLIVPPLFGGGATNIFLMRQFMKSLAPSAGRGAEIDGANKFQIFFRIMLPLCVPIIIFVMIGTFTSGWNRFFLGAGLRHQGAELHAGAGHLLQVSDQRFHRRVPQCQDGHRRGHGHPRGRPLPDLPETADRGRGHHRNERISQFFLVPKKRLLHF